MPEIESLEIQVSSKSQSASDGLLALEESLGKIKRAASGGAGLATVANQLDKLTEAVNRVNTGSAAKLNYMVSALNGLKTLNGIKISSTIATQITRISDAAIQMQGVDFSAFGRLATSLQPIMSIGKSGIGSIVSALRKIPEVAKSLASVDMGAFRQTIEDVANALQPLADQMQTIADGFSRLPNRMQQVISGTNRLAASNTIAAGSYINLYAKLRIAITAMRGAASVIAGFIKKSNNYVENINLFNASMGEYADKAEKYAEQVGEIMGIDPGEWMRNQGIFMTLATGFGVAGDRAYTMSKNLTQLTYDLSSFFNINYEDAFQKLQSGLSGELEPLRRLGYDLSQTKLQAIALSLGIDKAFTSMTQAEKAQLRYYAIMTQVTTAQGDMARTLEAPANQIRILKSQVEQAGRAIGNIFIPIINAVIPYLIAFANAIRVVASAVASMLGFKLPEVDYSGISAATGSVTELGDSLDRAGGSASSLQEKLAGFDEINLIASEGGGGGGGGGGILDDGWKDFELPEYDFIGDAVSTRVEGIMNALRPQIQWILDNMDKIALVAGVIGATMIGWNLSGMTASLSAVLSQVTGLRSYLLTLASMAITVGLSFSFTKDFLEEDGTIGDYMASLLTTAAGTAITGAVAKKVGLNGSYAAAATLAISAALDIFAIYGDVKDGGFDKKTFLTGIATVLKGVITGALLFGTTGAIVGGVITLAGVAISVGLGNINVDTTRTVERGEIDLTNEQARKFIEANYFKDLNVTAHIGSINAVVDDMDEAMANLEASQGEFDQNLNILKLGIDEKATYESMLNSLTGGATNGEYPVGSILGDITAALNASTNLLKIGGTADYATTIGASGMLQSSVESLGTDLAALLAKGMKEGLETEEQAMVKELSSWISDINNAFITGQIQGAATAKINLALNDLSREGFDNVISEFAEIETELRESIERQKIAEQSALYSLIAASEVNLKRLAPGSEDYNRELAYIDQLKADLVELDANMQSLIEYDISTVMEPARKSLMEGVREVFGTALDPDVFKNTGGSLYDNFAEYAVATSSGDYEAAAEKITNGLHTILKSALSEDEFDSFSKTAEALGVSMFELLPDTVRNELTESMRKAVGDPSTMAVLEQLGATIPEGFASDLAGAAEAGQNIANAMVAGVNDTDWYAQGYNAAAQMMNGFNAVSPVGGLKQSALAGFKRLVLKIPGFASGGFPNQGQLFVAREAGAEMVGTIGNKTTVANNDQIVEGISYGVSVANSEQNSLLREEIAVLRQLLNKEFKAEVVPSVALGRVNEKSKQLYTKAYG